MTRITGHVVIDASLDEVFDLVADERNEPRYNPRIVSADKVTEGPVGTGSRFVVRPQGMGRRGQMTMDVLDYDRPHRLHHRVRSSYMQVDGWLTFEEAHGGTRLSWDWDMVLIGATKVLSPLLTVVGPPWERRNWVGLKEYVESGPH